MAENPYESPDLNPSDARSHVGERPFAISAVCVVVGLSFIASLLVMPTLVSRLAKLYGTWYVAIWFVSLGVTIASIVGYWRMRRWGVYLYTVSFVVFSGIGLAIGLPFTVVGVVIPIAFILLGFAYIGRME